MKHLTLLTLLVFAAPFSWGEEVWYCVEEYRIRIEQDEETGAYVTNRYKPEKLTLKYEAESYRLAIKGRTWAGDDLFYMPCNVCRPVGNYLSATRSGTNFILNGDRFFTSSTFSDEVGMEAGTCTKF